MPLSGSRQDVTTGLSRTSASVRSANLALVLRQILHATTTISRADVAAALHMTRSTASRLVDELIAGGLLTEGSALVGARGRPAIPLAPASGRTLGLGIEVNVERIGVAVVDIAGNVLRDVAEPFDNLRTSPAGTLREVSRIASEILRTLPAGVTLAGAHLAIPGLVDREGATILRSPNLKWDGVRPADLLTGFLTEHGLRFRVGNDIDASGLTVVEELRGAGEAWASFIYITGEVGIGAAVILDGHLMSGRHGWASELGHVCVDPRGDVCGCGAVGCLETVAGLPAVLRATGSADLPEVLRRLADGDLRAVAALRRVGRAVGQALSAAMNLLDVGNVVLGGYLAECLPWLTDDLLAEVRARVLWGPYSPIEVTTVDDSPSRTARGAALASLTHIVNDPAAWLDARPTSH